jgi:hypothetical protein
MLAVVLIGIYSTLLLVTYGAGFLALAGKVLHFVKIDPPTLLQTALAGLIPLVWLTSLLSIFIPLNQTAAILLFFGAAGLFIWLWLRHRNWLTQWLTSLKGLHPLTLLAALLAIVTTVVLATLKPGNSDTGLYHAQAIRWIESFPVVPGLGNYHSRLAFNSNWFPLQAAFSFAFLKLRSFHLMGAVLTGLCLLYFTDGLQRLMRGQMRFSHWMRLAFLPLTFYVLASEISSTGTDLPVTLLTWVILCLWVEILEEPSPQWDWRKILLITLPICLVSIKLSAFPLLLVSAWILLPRLRQQNGLRHLAISVLLVVLLWTPWLIRNVILSGYLIYPPMGVDLFTVDWKIPAQAAHDEAEWITSWARFPRLDKEIVLAMPVTQWAPMWFDDLTANRQIILLVLAAAPFAIGMAALAAFAFFRHKIRRCFQPFILTWPVWLVTYAGILFWFFSVPRYRFGNGVLMAALVLIILCGAGLLRSVLRPFARFAPHTAAFVISMYLAFVLAASAETRTLSSRLLLPADYVNLPTAPCEFGNFSTACATQYQQCGYNPFPCAPQGIPNVVLRGKSFGDGFETR